jgi:hypothetical protein
MPYCDWPALLLPSRGILAPAENCSLSLKAAHPKYFAFKTVTATEEMLRLACPCDCSCFCPCASAGVQVRGDGVSIGLCVRLVECAQWNLSPIMCESNQLAQKSIVSGALQLQQATFLCRFSVGPSSFLFCRRDFCDQGCARNFID